MRNGLRELVLGEAAAGSADPLAAAGPRFRRAGGGKSRTLRRAWLDTFDWRLYRAGLTLEQVSARGRTELVLTGRDGELIAAQEIGSPQPGPPASRVSWPGLLGPVPPGPLKAQLEAVVGVRALLPVARAVSRVRDQRVLNADDKTIATVALDRMSVTFPAAAPAPPRLSVRPLRGYERPAGRLTDLLAAAPGIAESSSSALEAALAAAGRRPGDYTGKLDVRLAGAMPAADALAAVLTALLDMLEANISGTVRDLDTEFLHDLRVAVRRTRSVLKLAGDALPGGLASAFGPRFRWLGSLTTPTRDLDVYLLGYPAMAAALVGASPPDLEPLRGHLERRRAVTQRELATGLRSATFTRLTGQWRAALAGMAGHGRSQPTAAGLAAARIGRARRRVLTAGGAITGASAPERLHDLRKRGKELRYLLEIFASLHDPAERWQAVRELKELQDCLGEFQDAHVQGAEIRAFAAQLMAERAAPAATLLAMGEIAARLAQRKRQARSEFDGRFQAFRSPASQARISALTTAAAS